MLEQDFLKFVTIKYPLMIFKTIGTNFVLITLQVCIFNYFVGTNRLKIIFQTITTHHYFQAVCIGFFLLLTHIIPLSFMGPSVQTNNYLHGSEIKKDRRGSPPENRLHGIGYEEYDHNTQTAVRTGEASTFREFVYNVRAGHNIFRHPVAGSVWYLAWKITKSYVGVRYILLVFLLLNTIFFGKLVKIFTRSEHLSFLGMIYFILIPFSYTDGGNAWTLTMSKSHVGLFFLFLSILNFVNFLKKGKLTSLIFVLLFFVFSVSSWEVFAGFILCYPMIYVYASQLNIETEIGIDTKRIKTYLIVIIPLSVFSFFILKAVILQILIWNYTNIVPVNHFQHNLSVWFAKWVNGVFGVTINDDVSIHTTQFSYLKSAVSSLINAPRIFVRYHLSSPWSYFERTDLPYWVILFYMTSFGAINTFFLFVENNSHAGTKKNHALILISFGLILFAMPIATPWLTVGNIFVRYLYPGYFGVILAALAAMEISTGNQKKYSNVFILTCLTFFESSVFSPIF